MSCPFASGFDPRSFSSQRSSLPRPTAVTILGALNIVFGALGIFGAVLQLAFVWVPELGRFGGEVDDPFAHFTSSPVYSTWLKLGSVLGIPLTVICFVSGIGLLQMRSGARRLAVAYGWIGIAMILINWPLQIWYISWPILQQFNAGPADVALIGGAVGGLFGGCVGLIYPILLVYYLTRQYILDAFAGRWVPPGLAFDAGPQQAVLLAEDGEPSTNPFAAPRSAQIRAMPNPGAADGDTVLETFIPMKNGQALAAYYLGLFSLFPCLGLPLGIAAVVYGVRGLRLVRENPAVRGGIHAWVGVICGGLFGLFHLLLLIIVAAAAVAG